MQCDDGCPDSIDAVVCEYSNFLVLNRELDIDVNFDRKDERTRAEKMKDIYLLNNCYSLLFISQDQMNKAIY